MIEKDVEAREEDIETRCGFVAIVGRPNVGKSSLLNKAAGSERVVVNELAGTTRDPVDELVDIAGKAWRFVDTAGIRRRVHMAQGADFYASLRTTAALEKAEVAVVLLDVPQLANLLRRQKVASTWHDARPLWHVHPGG